MQNSIIENKTVMNHDVSSSRRNFLTHIAWGSLLLLSTTGVSNAKAKAKNFAIHKKTPSQKTHAKVTHVSVTKNHEKPKSFISTRLAKKSEHRHEAERVIAHSSHDRNNIHHARHQGHSRHRIQLASHHQPIFNRYREDDLVLDSYEERSYYSRKLPSKMISLQNPHTGDHLRLTYFERGLYIEDALQEIDYVLRDYHTGDVHPIDPTLLDQLYELKSRLGVNQPFHVISGYRSPETNANLRRHSDGVAKNSLHMQGRAIDIRLEGYDVRTIRDAALSIQRGGVGYYPVSNFIHLDTGEVRTWGA